MGTARGHTPLTSVHGPAAWSCGRHSCLTRCPAMAAKENYSQNACNSKWLGMSGNQIFTASNASLTFEQQSSLTCIVCPGKAPQVSRLTAYPMMLHTLTLIDPYFRLAMALSKAWGCCLCTCSSTYQVL